MTRHYLEHFFQPSSIAVFGASERPNAVGSIVFENLVGGTYKGHVYPINPKHELLRGQRCYPSLLAIGHAVDLAVICTPAATVPDIIRQCGEAGVRAAVVLTAGFGETPTTGRQLAKQLTDTAQQFGVRLMGPNCLGVLRPSIGMNASFSRIGACAGGLALVSQSGALCTAILDWAAERQIGFSSIVSLGNAADLDFGEILDYLTFDAQTESILLYIEGVRDARKFMSGLRAASRLKPVIVLKAGRHGAATRAAVSHTAALVGSDDVFAAALQRAGAVRAMTIGQLFSVAAVLAARQRARGNRLAIVSNGGGPAVMATDRAVDLAVALAELEKSTCERLDSVLPPQWSHANPVDIIGDATPERFGAAVSACLQDANVDGLVVMLTPQAMTQPVAAAQAVVDAVNKTDKPVLTCWMGGQQVRPAWDVFAKNGVPHFRTPEACIEAFACLCAFHQNQALLLQVPDPLSAHKPPDVDGARLIIESALAEGRKVLTTPETKAVLSAFGIPVTPTMVAHSAVDALVAAESVGFPVVMKIHASEITHKSDVGGVRLNIANAQAVQQAYHELLATVRAARPDLTLNSVTVEPMAAVRNGRELLVGVINDEVFGPAITFGAGGIAVEVLRDRAVTLPPLNSFIARQLINQTRVAKMLGKFRHLPAVNMDAIENVLLRLSDLVCELPQIQELDINPLIADEQGAVAVDARVLVRAVPPAAARYSHMAIHPYPNHLVRQWQLTDGTQIVIRPIRPEDANIEQTFIKHLSPESKYFRFMQTVAELTPALLVRFTQIDYYREMAFIAVTREHDHDVELGVARYIINPDGDSCEFALVVADQWHRRGIGTKLLMELMQEAKSRGLKSMHGEVLAENHDMLELVTSLSFVTQRHAEDPGVIKIARTL